MSRPIDRTGLCAWPPCTFWAVRGEYCEEHYTKRLHAEHPDGPHPGSHKPSEHKLNPQTPSGKHRHQRPDGSRIASLGDGSFDPGTTTVTKAEYYRRQGEN